MEGRILDSHAQSSGTIIDAARIDFKTGKLYRILHPKLGFVNWRVGLKTSKYLAIGTVLMFLRKEKEEANPPFVKTNKGYRYFFLHAGIVIEFRGLASSLYFERAL